MTNEDRNRLVAVVNAYERMKSKGTPAEYMEYMRAKEALGYQMTAGQRGFMQATRREASQVEE